MEGGRYLIIKKDISPKSKYLLTVIGLGIVLILSWFIEPSGLPGVCVFKFLTGVPCMFCGLTRAFHEIALGHFAEALQFHPLSFLAFGLVFFFLVFSLIKVLFWERLKDLPEFEGFLLIGTFIVFTLFWIYRLISGQLV